MANGTTAQKDSYRVMFKFWLDHAKDTDLLLSDFCEQMKNERRFTQTIRDGLTLIRDLRAGRVDSLIKMFPAIVELLRRETPDDPPPAGGESSENISRLEEKLDFLIMTYGTGSKGLVAAARENQLTQNPGMLPPSKPRQLPALATPDLPDFEVSRSAPGKSKTHNFLQSLSGIIIQPNATSESTSKRKSKRQGQRTSEQATQPVAAITEALEPAPRALAGANIQIADPSFDDLSVDF